MFLSDALTTKKKNAPRCILIHFLPSFCVSCREQILALHQQECAYLEDVTFAMQQRYSEVDSETQQDYQSTRDYITNKVSHRTRGFILINIS